MKKQLLVTLSLLAALGAGCASSTTTSAPTQPPATPQPAAAQATDTGTAAAAQAYTLDEVAKHASETDCWMAIDGKVYDVTKSVDKHPGGPAILKGCGKEATEMFNAVEKHGGKAREFLPSLQIGNLK